MKAYGYRGLVFAALILLLAWLGSFGDFSQNQIEAPSDVEVPVEIENSPAGATKAEEKSQVKSSAPKSSVTGLGQNSSSNKMNRLLEEFRGKDLLAGGSLESLRKKASEQLRADDVGYQVFLSQMMATDGKNIEAPLFFTEVYTSEAPNPVSFTKEILRAKDWGEGAPAIKAFVVDSLLAREQSGQDFQASPLPAIEKALLEFVRSSSSINLVHDSLIHLKEQYGYELRQLEELSEGRPEATQKFLQDLF